MKAQIFVTDINEISIPADMPLSDYRREKLDKQCQLLQRQGLACEYLLREALKGRGLCPDEKLGIAADEKGKPRLIDTPLHFSLSHSHSAAACALSSRELGLDIQKISPFNERLAKRCFSASELEHIYSSQNRDIEFTRLWCAKESYIKSIGSTLSGALSSALVHIDAQGGLSCKGNRIYCLEWRDYVLCCCSVSGGSLEIEITELSI